jgi:Zn-finger nucleic acid-binding protein
MEKTLVPGADGLQLDNCPRCGGVWFDLGEVSRLRGAQPRPLWTKLQPNAGVHRVRCHSCGAPVSRHDDECVVCAWKPVIDCPSCARPMKRETHDGVKLDLCTHCKGVWFDHDELAAIWNMRFDAAARRRGIPEKAGDVAAVPLHLVEVLAYTPDAFVYGAYYAGRGAIELAGAAPDVAVGAIEAAGEVASSVFEVIVEIIAGLFG